MAGLGGVVVLVTNHAKVVGVFLAHDRVLETQSELQLAPLSDDPNPDRGPGVRGVLANSRSPRTAKGTK